MQAEQLWHLLVPEDHDRDYHMYPRSFSVPLANDQTPSWKSSIAPHYASDTENINTNTSSSGSSAARGEFRVARSRARSLPHAPAGGGGRGQRGSDSGSNGGRLGVHGFLRLADLLHEKVVESVEDDDDDGTTGRGGGEGGGGRPCYIVGYDNDNDVAGVEDNDLGIGSAHGVGGGCGGDTGCDVGRRGGGHLYGDGFREECDDEEDSQQDSQQEEQCCFSGDESVSNTIFGETSNSSGDDTCGGARAGGEGGDAAATFSPRQRLRRCAWQQLVKAKRIARRIVGQAWFFQMSRGIAVLLTVLALVWTPRSQQGYDGCVAEGGKDCRTTDSVDFRREDLLRRLHGLVLLAFFAEMMAKVKCGFALVSMLVLVLVLVSVLGLAVMFFYQYYGSGMLR